MTDTKKAVADKAKNYSAEQEAVIRNASPLNLESAKVIGEQIGKNYRSVISKAKSMPDVEYIAKPPAPKRETPETKAEIVMAISTRLDGVSLDGLEKATVKALNTLRDALPC